MQCGCRFPEVALLADQCEIDAFSGSRPVIGLDDPEHDPVAVLSCLRNRCALRFGERVSDCVGLIVQNTGCKNRAMGLGLVDEVVGQVYKYTGSDVC